MILNTDRLTLRLLEQTDYGALTKILQDSEVMAAYEHAFSDGEVQTWLDRQIARYQADGVGLWAVCLMQTGEVIGQCGLTMQDCFGRKVLEVGYLFQKAFWRRGFATEAARACRDYAFERLNASEVYSIIRDTNKASRSVALRNGMSVCGEFVKHYYGVDMPHIVYRILRGEWESIRKKYGTQEIKKPDSQAHKFD